MAKRIVNRRELREASDAAERMEDDVEVDEEVDEEDAAEDEESEPRAAVKKKPAAKRKSRAKTAKEVRLKAFWGVFSQSLRRVAVFEYHQRPLAEKKAAEMTESQKTPHFVQLVKEVIEQ